MGLDCSILSFFNTIYGYITWSRFLFGFSHSLPAPVIHGLDKNRRKGEENVIKVGSLGELSQLIGSCVYTERYRHRDFREISADIKHFPLLLRFCIDI